MPLRDDYNERKDDVEAYVTLLDQIDARRFPQKSRYILRANVFVLLYNLIESTVANCGKELDSGCANITTNQIHDLTEPIVNYWMKFTLLGYLTPKGEVRFKDNVNSGNIDVETLTKKLLYPLNPQSLLELKFDFIRGGGNLDDVKIKKIFDTYGIDTVLYGKFKRKLYRYRYNAGESVLQFIKDTRNALAHGEKSFTEFGVYSSRDIKRFAKTVFEYLEFLMVLFLNYSYVNFGNPSFVK